MRNKVLVLLSLSGIITLTTCKKDEFKNLDCSKIDTRYSTGIRPIISGNCTLSGCHDGSSSQPDLRTYNQLYPYLTNGKFNEVVIKNKTMPKNGSLNQEERNKIKCWLDAGAPDN